MMTHRIEHIKDRYVIGLKSNMSIQTIQEATAILAKQFMPRRHEVGSRIGEHVFSIQDYANIQLKEMTPATIFNKWIGVEVSNFDKVPEGMEAFILKAGMYAVFTFKGSMKDYPKIRQYIFQDWLPNSKYQLDTRAHFEALPEDYSKDLQCTEEDIWIPVKK